MKSIYDLSWSETSFIAKLQLFFKSRKQEKEKIRSDDKLVRAGGYSALSSTYYSVVSTAFSQFKTALRLTWLAPMKIGVWFLTWLPLAMYCYFRMLSLSNRIVDLVGYDGMSVDQCDVRQSVLRRRGYYEEAKKCIRFAFDKNSEKAHTRGLLRVGLAEIYLHEGDWKNAGMEMRIALTEAMEAEKQDPRQAVRIYKNCAKIADYIGQGDLVLGSQLRCKAKELAQEIGAHDQLLKL